MTHDDLIAEAERLFKHKIRCDGPYCRTCGISRENHDTFRLACSTFAPTPCTCGRDDFLARLRAALEARHEAPSSIN